MGHLLSYTLYSSLFLLASYLIYKIMLAGEKQTAVNRVIIFGLYAASFIAPALLAHGDDIAAKAVDTIAAVDFGEPEVTHIGTASPNLLTALILAYIAGMAATAILTLVSAVNIFIIISRGDKTPRDGYTLVTVDDGKTAPFSWGRYIVASRSDIAEAGDMIIAHELGHIRGHHWLDLVFARIICVIEWYNPAAWLMFDELKDVHEYAADEYVLVHGFNARQYQMLLIKKAAGTRFQALANSFNHSKLKNRITMMLQKRSSRWAGAKALFVVPLAGLALGAFAETVYLCPSGKDTQENAAFQIFDASDSSRMTVRVGDPADKRIVIVGKDGRETSQPAPLYLVDGEAVDDLKQVDKKRIRSITVLKDSSCTEYVEKYGDKAKNGVILVTLKKEGEPDSAVPADAKNMDDVVVVGSGTSAKNGLVEWNSDEWKARQKKFAEMDAYFQSDEWKARQKKLEEGAAYFNSDEWKAVEKKLAKVDKYFQSDEWKESQKRLSRFSAGASGDTRIYIIDGKKVTEAEVKALAGNDIASMNVNKDKQDDGSVVSTFIVTTKGKTARAENRSGKTILDMRGRMAGVKMPFMSVSGKKVTISRDGDVETYKGIFRVTDLSRVPNDAVIRLDGKPANRLQIMAAKKLRRARYYTGKAAVKQSGAKHFLDCHTRK